MYKLTIITPTYNRANTLPRLYDSLSNQSIKEFVWILLDDGSTDETEKMAENWRVSGQISMMYKKQANGGKHRALNCAIKLVETELIFIVDSDDYLPIDSVETILKCHEKFGSYQGLCGYSFLRFYSTGEVNEAYFPEDYKIDTYCNVRINGGIGGDKAEVFYTEILKEFPFPEFEGEKFLPEDIVWMQMSGPYQMVHINKCIYISDYLEGGLTKSGRKMKLKSPQGMILRSQIYLNDNGVRLRVKIKMGLLNHVYGCAAGIPSNVLAEKIDNKVLFWLTLIPGKLLYYQFFR